MIRSNAARAGATALATALIAPATASAAVTGDLTCTRWTVGMKPWLHADCPLLESHGRQLTLVGAEMASLSAGSASRAFCNQATAQKVTLPMLQSSLVNV